MQEHEEQHEVKVDNLRFVTNGGFWIICSLNDDDDGGGGGGNDNGMPLM